MPFTVAKRHLEPADFITTDFTRWWGGDKRHTVPTKLHVLIENMDAQSKRQRKTRLTVSALFLDDDDEAAAEAATAAVICAS